MRPLSILACGFLLLAAPGAKAMSVAILDPYLINPGNLGDLQLQAFLAGNPTLPDYEASALAEDGIAAGIVIAASDSSAPVTFEVQNAGGLVPYADDFLQNPSAAGSPSLTVRPRGTSAALTTQQRYSRPRWLHRPLRGCLMPPASPPARREINRPRP